MKTVCAWSLSVCAVYTPCPVISSCYNDVMAGKIPLVIVFLCVLIAQSAVSSPASVGSAFADTYSSFSPLYSLYKAYANFLFSGTQVVVPKDLDKACPQLQSDLNSLQIEILTQTDSQRIEQVTRIAHLRQATVTFCRTYGEMISSIASFTTTEIDTLKQAADDGLFAAVSDENKELTGLFSSTLDTYTGTRQWMFAVAFSMRTILEQQDLVKLDSSLREILLGPEDSPYGEGIIPPEVLPQSRELATLAGIDLDRAKRERARVLAREIYDFLVGEN